MKTELCRHEFGYDVAIDYQAGSLDAAIAEACPKGIDVYFDNTAGEISDAVLKNLAVGARVIICGTASIASWNPAPLGPRVERHLLVKRARMQGFLIFDYTAKIFLKVLSRHPIQSPACTEVRIWASASFVSRPTEQCTNEFA
jgi:NADPH-dependent curcumin reductase